MSGNPSGDARPSFVRGLFMHMTFDDQLQRAFDTLTGRLQDGIRRDVQVAIDEVAAAYAARETEVVREMDGVRTGADRLLDSVRAIGRARSLSETLDTLVSCAAREAERAAVLIVRGGALRGWRFVGFGALDENPGLHDSFDDRGLSDRARQAHDVAADDRGCAIPLALGSDIVSILFADNGNRAALELLARHAARSLEALVAFKAARAILMPKILPPSPPRGGSGLTGVAAQECAAQAETDEVAARRYARLLVSEIRLYHEPEIVAGRRERNLTSRLGGEISRARSLYERRVPPAVREHAAYFEDELVRTLADGDATLLEVQTS